MPASSILAFWGIALLLIVVPGADWAFTVSAGLRGRSVIPAVAGIVAGYAAMTVVVAAGVGALVAQTPVALTVLTVLGGGYLMWYGTHVLISPSSPAKVAGADVRVAAAADPTWKVLAQGARVSGGNPKGLLIFVALLPQFASPHRAWPLAIQMSVLGLVFMITCAAFYLIVGSLARTILRSRPAAARAVSRLSGIGMIAIGALLITDRLA